MRSRSGVVGLVRRKAPRGLRVSPMHGRRRSPRLRRSRSPASPQRHQRSTKCRCCRHPQKCRHSRHRLNRRSKPPSDQPAKGQGSFQDYGLGFIHIDIKHLPKLQTANGEKRKRYLYVAIDRCSRSVHLAVKEDETEKSAITFLNEAAAAFPFPLTHVLPIMAAASHRHLQRYARH